MMESAGILTPPHPLCALLAEQVLPAAFRVTPGAAEFEVFHLNGPEGAVYLYLHGESGVRVVGKYYGKKWIKGSRSGSEELRSLLLEREFNNLSLLRALGLGAGSYFVPRPLARADHIDWVLLQDYVEGINLHHAIWEAVTRGEEGPLYRYLTLAAELLAHLHTLAPSPEVLGVKDPFRYLHKVLAQLRGWEIIDETEAARFAALGGRWAGGWPASGAAPVMIHGDATPEHFLFDERAGRMGVIDVETLRLGDPAEDLGYLTAEIKHLFWSYTQDPWSSEPFVRHVYATYERAAGRGSPHVAGLTERGRYYMGCVELRIARNSWLSLDYRRSLIAEAERCLMI